MKVRRRFWRSLLAGIAARFSSVVEHGPWGGHDVARAKNPLRDWFSTTQLPKVSGKDKPFIQSVVASRRRWRPPPITYAAPNDGRQRHSRLPSSSNCLLPHRLSSAAFAASVSACSWSAYQHARPNELQEPRPGGPSRSRVRPPRSSCMRRVLSRSSVPLPQPDRQWPNGVQWGDHKPYTEEKRQSFLSELRAGLRKLGL